MPGITTQHIDLWLAELQKGNPVARQEILNHSQDRLKHMVRLQFRLQPDLRRLEETDDILQKALLRLHKALESVPPVSTPEYFGLAAQQIRWVLLDLGREMANLKNNEAFEFRMFSDKFFFLEPKDLSTPPANLLEWEHFHKTINDLPPLERSIFDLIFYQGLSQEEVGKILNLPLRSVKRYWRNAKIMLYEKLDREYPAG